MRANTGWRAKTLLAAAIAMVILFFPSFRTEDVKALRSPGSIAIVGNSVIKGVSKCDTDKRGIGEMLAADLDRSVNDLSVAGQAIDQSLQLAALALKNPDVATVVLPVIVSSKSVDDSFDLQTWMFYRIANSQVPPPDLMSRIADGRFLSGEPAVNAAAFDYKGKRYPDYNGIKAGYFPVEKAHMPCPENSGHDLRFVEAYYDFVYRAPGLSDGLARSLSRLHEDARRRGKQIVFVLMPVNVDVMRRFASTRVGDVERSAAELEHRLLAEQADVVNLTTAVREATFADAWCACGHLQQAGRTFVAEAAARRIVASPSRPVARRP